MVLSDCSSANKLKEFCLICHLAGCGKCTLLIYDFRRYARGVGAQQLSTCDGTSNEAGAGSYLLDQFDFKIPSLNDTGP